MGLTHGSVSRRVQQVEDWLGTRLFDRRGRGVTLTIAGQSLVLRVREGLTVISGATDQWRKHRGRETVHLSVLPSFAKLWLLPRLSRLQGDPSEFRCELVVEHGLANFEGDDIDVAIRYGTGNWPGIFAKPLFKEMLVPVAAIEIVKKLGKRPTPDALLGQSMINDTDASGWRAWFGAAGIPYKPRSKDLRFEDYDLVLAAAEAGLGIALLRRPFADDVLKRGTLQIVTNKSIENSKTSYVVTRSSVVRQATQSFIDRVMNEANQCSSLGKS